MKAACLACLFICLVRPAGAGEKSSVDLLIVYYSAQGHTRSIAQAVAKGAASIKGVAVKILPVEEAKAEHAVQADATILGSPVYNANVGPALQNFINSWPIEGQLRDKVGAAFATGGGLSGGEELVQTTILHSMPVRIGRIGFRISFIASTSGKRRFAVRCALSA